MALLEVRSQRSAGASGPDLINSSCDLASAQGAITHTNPAGESPCRTAPQLPRVQRRGRGRRIDALLACDRPAEYGRGGKNANPREVASDRAVVEISRMTAAPRPPPCSARAAGEPRQTNAENEWRPISNACLRRARSASVLDPLCPRRSEDWPNRLTSRVTRGLRSPTPGRATGVKCPRPSRACAAVAAGASSASPAGVPTGRAADGKTHAPWFIVLSRRTTRRYTARRHERPGQPLAANSAHPQLRRDHHYRGKWVGTARAASHAKPCRLAGLFSFLRPSRPERRRTPRR